MKLENEGISLKLAIENVVKNVSSFIKNFKFIAFNIQKQKNE